MFACGFVRIWLDSNGKWKRDRKNFGFTYEWYRMGQLYSLPMLHSLTLSKDKQSRCQNFILIAPIQSEASCTLYYSWWISNQRSCAMCMHKFIVIFFLSVSSAVFCFEYITLFLYWQKSSDSCKRYCCALCVWVCTDYIVIVVVAEGRNQQSLQYFSKIVHAFACSHVIQTRSSERLSLALDEQNE